MSSEPSPAENRKGVYERVCDSYHAVDDFRMKLLGLLPVATGTGVFLLLNGNKDLAPTAARQAPATQQVTSPEAPALLLSAIGVFGAAFTLGLFAYELFGIKRCHYLIQAGKRLEIELGVPGQFASRPQALMRVVNEPLASAFIYPASLAAWMFLAVAFHRVPLAVKVGLPLSVFLIFFVLTMGVAERLKHVAREGFIDDVYNAIKGENGTRYTKVESLARYLQTDVVSIQKAVTLLQSPERHLVRDDHGALSAVPAGDTRT